MVHPLAQDWLYSLTKSVHSVILQASISFMKSLPKGTPSASQSLQETCRSIEITNNRPLLATHTSAAVENILSGSQDEPEQDK